MRESYVRFNFLFFLTFFYLFITLYYSLDLLGLVVSHLSQKFSLDLMLTQLEDLSTLLLGLVRFLLLIFMVPFFLLQFLLFLFPAFFVQEKLAINLFFFRFLFGLHFSSFFFFSIFFFFSLRYSSQAFSFNLGTSTRILVDFKKMFVSFFVLFKFTLLCFLPLNYCLVFFPSSRRLSFHLIKLNLFLYIYVLLLDLFHIENAVQFNLLLFVQLSQLEFFVLMHSMSSCFCSRNPFDQSFLRFFTLRCLLLQNLADPHVKDLFLGFALVF